LSPGLAFVALVLAIGVVSKERVERGNRMSIVWACFFLGILFWFISEVAWDSYPFLLGIPTPFPSVADVLGIAGYVPAIVGLLVLIRPFGEVVISRKILAGSLLTSVLVLALSAPPFLHRPSSSVALVVELIYVTLDVILLSIIAPTLIIFRAGSFWKPILLLALGISFALFSELVANWTNTLTAYYPGNPSELLLNCAYLFAAAGFYTRIRQLSARG
jgi:hypothetical protein